MTAPRASGSVRERSIIFSGESVRAILEGRKTQTRRIVKPQPELNPRGGFFWKGKPVGSDEICWTWVRSPRLWVREMYSIGGNGPFYKATDSDGTIHVAWQSAMFMPRKFSRLTLEVTAVHLQRLEEISESDAQAEGVTPDPCTHPDCVYDSHSRCAADSYRGAFAEVWNKINGKRAPWGSQPWVWVIEFRRIE